MSRRRKGPTPSWKERSTASALHLALQFALHLRCMQRTCNVSRGSALRCTPFLKGARATQRATVPVTPERIPSSAWLKMTAGLPGALAGSLIAARIACPPR